MSDDEVVLSARRGKTKWSLDPRNTFWSNDKSRFGFRMLEQMGWVEGKGLGVNEDGAKDHVKISKKTDNSGVGAGKSFGDEWIGHQDTFESLLADLNQSNQDSKEENTTKDLTSAAKKTKKLTYQKSIRSKDIHHKSKEDMNCVLGRRKREHSTNTTEEQYYHSDNSRVNPTDPITGITTVTSELDLNKYFAQMEKKRKKEQDCVEKPKKLKKSKKEKDRVKSKRTKSTL